MVPARGFESSVIVNELRSGTGKANKLELRFELSRFPARLRLKVTKEDQSIEARKFGGMSPEIWL